MTKAPKFDGTQPCATADPELFFPEGGSSVHQKHKKLVEPLCNSCQFSTECLQYALESDVLGIWAATTERERQLIRRKTGIKIKHYMYKDLEKLLK